MTNPNAMCTMFERRLSTLKGIASLLNAEVVERGAGYTIERINGDKVATLYRDGSVDIVDYHRLPKKVRNRLDHMCTKMGMEPESPAAPAPSKSQVNAVVQPLAWVSLRNDSGRTIGVVEATKLYGRPTRTSDKPCNAAKGARNKSIRLSSGECTMPSTM